MNTYAKSITAASMLIMAFILALIFILQSTAKHLAASDKGYFSKAQTQLQEERYQDIVDAAKKIIRDSEDYLIDIPKQGLRSVTESDLDCIRSSRDIITDSQVEVPTYFDSDVDLLLTHLAKAVGNDDIAFNRKDLSTLRLLSDIIERHADTIQLAGSESSLHLLEYKIATRIH